MKKSEQFLVEATRWENMAKACHFTDPAKVVCQREAEALFDEAATLEELGE